MKNLALVLGLLLVLAMDAVAQDWQDDDETNTRYNCDLLRAVIRDYGDQDFLQTGPDSYASLAAFLDTLFPKCLQKTADKDSVSGSDAESDESVPVTAVLETGEMMAFRDYCTLIIVDDDVAEENRVYVSSTDHELISVEMYLPGAAEALAVVDTAVEDLMGLPVRIETFGDADFSVGRYTFDVRVEEDVHRFHWVRKDPENFGFMVSCVGEEGPVILPQIRAAIAAESEETDAAAAPQTDMDATDEAEVFAVLERNSMHFLDDFCSVMITDQFDTPFNVTLTGNERDSMSVDVYLPGESDAAAVSETRLDMLEGGIPIRIEWIAGEAFPIGTYTFDVHKDDATFRFEWLREDENDYTLIFSCSGEQGFGDVLARLADGDSFWFEDIGCALWIDVFDADMNIVVAGPDPEAIAVDLYFPRENQPRAPDGAQRNEFESGTKYRGEWISGDDFPLGTYNIVLHADGDSYRVTWERLNPDYNLIFVRCEEAES
ncbi:MAG: hypothetical protein OXG78_02860 [Chloroflexi bacterium]|nr:hypothetical protein [Chloroflexota bacterium]